MKKIDWSILKRSVSGETSYEEEKMVQCWKDASEEQCVYYEKLLLFHRQASKEGVDVDRNFQDFIRKISLSSRRRYLRVLRYVAAACLVGIGILILYIHRPSSLPAAFPEAIVAGTSKAILYPGSGQPIYLEKEKRHEIMANTVFRLKQERNVVNYTVADTTTLPSEIHTLKIPHGGEFQLCLSDGTHVYINSESEISYPAVFTGNERRITLSGEAYFQVARSTAPFIVIVNNMEVKVLGTEFNLRAYTDENSVQATLVKGKVEVAANQDRMLLIPGEQAVLSAGRGLFKRTVDVTKTVAWKDGFVAFEDERLEDIMTKLSKWYNFEVFYESAALQDIRFTGNIDRYGDIRILLDKIEKLDVVRFAVRGHCITVKPK